MEGGVSYSANRLRFSGRGGENSNAHEKSLAFALEIRGSVEEKRKGQNYLFGKGLRLRTLVWGHCGKVKSGKELHPVPRSMVLQDKNRLHQYYRITH